MSFREYDVTREDVWRSIVLFGRNVASYKFALAKSLIDLADRTDTFVPLEGLAEPFAKSLCEQLKVNDTQTTSRSSKFLDELRRFNRGEITWTQAVAVTEKLGFQNVIDAFHVLPGGDAPMRFFMDERRNSSTSGIRLTDEFFHLRESVQFVNLASEVDARWRLVTTSWHLKMPSRALSVEFDPEGLGLFTIDDSRRVSLAGCREALNGYQKGKCFYSFTDITIDPAAGLDADVDHFFPHVLKHAGMGHRVDQVWNLVLASQACNRGQDGKFERVPSLRMLERLHRRNEYLISSHHPLRETLIMQTGETEEARRQFLQSMYDFAKQTLIGTWEPPFELEPCF